MKKKILIVKISYEQIGGIDRQILRISKYLFKNTDFEPILATSNINSPLAVEFMKLGLKVYVVNISSQNSIKESCISLNNLVEQLQPTIIQSHLFRESIFCRFVKFKNKRIKHVFRAQTYIDCAWIPSWKKNIYHLFDKLTASFVDVFVANGPVLKEELIKRSLIKKSKIIDVINGCEFIGEPDVLYKAPLNRNIVMIANLLENKGHDVLIDGLSILKRRGIIVNVRLIGGEITGGTEIDDGLSFTDRIKDRAIKCDVLNQIEFYGYSNDVFSAIKNIQIVVLPSDSEGVPNCLLEAISLKKIVIASDVGAVSSFIIDSKTGFLHEKMNPLAFANSIENVFKLSTDELNAIQESGYAKWRNDLSIEKMMNNIINIYQEELL